VESRLKISDFTIREILGLSYIHYGKEIDNKVRRMELDVISATLKARRRLTYNKSSHQWEQAGREVRIDFLIKTDPISYERSDDLPFHRFPVTFIIREFEKGIDSAFKWRTGSFKKPIFSNKKVSRGKTKRDKDRIKREKKRILETNIKNGIQFQFFFDSMQVLWEYGLLFGPNTTNHKSPKIRNPKEIIFFDKHALWIVEKILIPLFNTKTGFIVNRLFRD
jgi:hypothetical protein